MCIITRRTKNIHHTKLSLQQEDRPIVFWMTTFSSQIITFFTTWTYPKLTKLGIYITPARKIHNKLLSSISTIRWRYNQGKCVLAYNSHILCLTFKNCIYSALQKDSAPLEPFHILSSILLGFYVIDQHKVVHLWRVRKLIHGFNFVFTNQKSVMCQKVFTPLSQSFVEPPFAAITAAGLFGLVSTSDAHIETEMFAHSSSRNSSSLVWWYFFIS